MQHQKGCGCLSPARKSPGQTSARYRKEQQRWFQSSQQRDLADLAFSCSGENCQQPPNPPVHFQSATQPLKGKHLMNIHFTSDIVLFHGCRWSGSNWQAPEQEKVRDKQDWTLLKGWAGSWASWWNYPSLLMDGKQKWRKNGPPFHLQVKWWAVWLW